jgi:branched-chain amino acid transport system ATP-binding protein
MSTPLLALRGLVKRFGALVVTDQVDLTVEPGELHALIGPNGAGKSCLIGQISGELRSDAGEVLFRGERIDRLDVPQRAQRGLARAYQVPRLFGSLDAGGNASVAEIARARSGFRLWRRASGDARLERASALALNRVGLSGEALAPGRSASDLAHGDKRLLELAMGFAGDPALLLLDEPLAGLGPGDSAAMVALLRSLKGRYGILLVEHDVEAVFALADRVSVLVAGRIIASGPAAVVRNDPAVRAAYLGQGD